MEILKLVRFLFITIIMIAMIVLKQRVRVVKYPTCIGIRLPTVNSVELFHISKLMSLAKDCMKELCLLDMSRIAKLVEHWQFNTMLWVRISG